MLFNLPTFCDAHGLYLCLDVARGVLVRYKDRSLDCFFQAAQAPLDACSVRQRVMMQPVRRAHVVGGCDEPQAVGYAWDKACLYVSL